MELRWLASSTASWCHAAAALARGAALADAALADALREPADQLAQTVTGAGAPLAIFFDHLVPLSAGIHNHRELALAALTKAAGRGRAELLKDSAARALVALLRAGEAAQPTLVHDLELRSGPIQEQWQARGPGLLAEIGRRTEKDVLADRADVVLVHPALGGAGLAHLTYNAVTLEAVLANPLPELPEVLRLGWLLATLKMELPAYAERLPRDRADWLGRLALVPPALAAAEEVELARFSPQLLETALVAWRLIEAPDATFVDAVLRWWETYESSRPSWPLALQALAQMTA